MNNEFSSLFQWFLENKLSIHFEEDDTKSSLFSKARGLREIDISFAGHSIKQHKTVEYFVCQLDSKLSGESMASKVLKKINAKLKFLYRQSRYLTSAYKRLLWMFLMVSVFKEKFKIQSSKSSKQMYFFCLNLFLRSHIDPSYFRMSRIRQSRILYCECCF